MMAYHFQINFRCIWVLAGMLFTSILCGQSKDDAALYAIWSDTTKPEVDRIDAYFTRLNDMKVLENEFKLNEKWFAESPQAIVFALKLDRKEYLPLFYLASAFKYALNENDYASGCIEANKVIESAKLANASKFPVFVAYMILLNACAERIRGNLSN